MCLLFIQAQTSWKTAGPNPRPVKIHSDVVKSVMGLWNLNMTIEKLEFETQIQASSEWVSD